MSENPKRRKLLMLGAILLGLTAMAKVASGLYDKQQQRAQVAAAFKDHGLAAIPETATGREMDIACSWLFCSIKTGFEDKPSNIAQWAKGSSAIASRQLGDAKPGAATYELVSEPHHRSTVSIDERSGKVTASFMLRTCPYCQGRGD